jgi:thymidylate synthase (FAD)
METKILHHIKVLDHGYVNLIETWGSDERIIEAARMSTNKGFQGWGGLPCPECALADRLDPVDLLFKNYESKVQAEKCKCKGSGVTIGDEKLLRYLWEHNHATPFEMAGMIIEVQAPIFVFREWHRHRTQSYNELSARYTPIPDVNYIPTVERLMLNSKTNKQAGVIAGAATLTEKQAEGFRKLLVMSYQDSELLYQNALQAGVPKELARIHLPVGRYSRMRASANLRNWLGFLTLRMAEGAQWEIRQYANAVADLVKQSFPRTYSLFNERK